MNRDEFIALPASIALGLIWDIGVGKKLADVEAPKSPLPPKFDTVIYRKEGITFASEYDAEGLRFWHARFEEGAKSGGEYADKDAKRAKALSYFIAWRTAFPSAFWSGERNREHVTARAPSGKPEVYPRDGERRQAPAAAPNFDDDEQVYDDEQFL